MRKEEILPLFLSLFFCAMSIQSSRAQPDVVVLDIDPALLDLSQARELKIEINDNVIDGCWINPNSARDAVEVELARSGFAIRESPTILVLNATGYETSSGSCVANWDLQLFTYTYETRYHDNSEMWALFTREAYSPPGGILSGPRTYVNEQLSKNFRDAAVSLIALIERQKGQVMDQITNIEDPILRQLWLDRYQ